MTAAPPLRTIALAALLLGAAPSAYAQDAIADFYKGKSIRFVIGAISGLIPAVQASRLRIVDALRRVE